MEPEARQPGEADQLVAAHAVYHKLLREQKSALLATVNEDGSPLASYAPFAVDEDKHFYLFVSTLSQHTANLARSGRASLLLIADEAHSPQIFARERLTFQCAATEIARDDEAWPAAAALYTARFGSMFQLLRSLADFRMVRLTPQQGQLVVGFGQAYALGGEKLEVLSHRRP